jgi:hypothetical protein
VLANWSFLLTLTLLFEGLEEALGDPALSEFLRFLSFLAGIIVPVWLQIGMNLSLLKKPSAFLPLLMSAAALSLLIGYFVTGPHAPNLVTENGITRQDEGTAAHLWQLLMGLQLPIILYFALRWLPQQPKAALMVLAAQFVAGVAAAFPVWYLGA